MPLGSLWELAAIADMPSVPTLRQFIRDRPNFPVIQHGRKGAPYIIDLDAAAAFVREHWRDSRHELSGVSRASRAARAAQPMQTTLFDMEGME